MLTHVILSPYDRMQLLKTLRAVTIDCDNCEEEVAVADIDLVESTSAETSVAVEADVRRVDSAISPYFYAFHGHHICKVVMDTRATSTVQDWHVT